MLPIYLHNSSNQVQKNLANPHQMQSSKQEDVVAKILGGSNPDEIQKHKSLQLLADNSTSTPVSSTVDARIKSKWYQQTSSLGSKFTPGPFDVICGRGKAVFNHPGNKFFRDMVKETTFTYSQATNKVERSVVVSDVVDRIRSKGNGFVKKDRNGKWMEVGDLLAREKVGQMLRNALSSKYRSSVASKKQRRRDFQVKSIDSLHEVMASNSTVKDAMDTIKEGAHDVSLSDEAMLALFVQHQSNMMEQFKTDTGLVERFLQAEVTACLVLNDDTNGADEDGDVQMTCV